MILELTLLRHGQTAGNVRRAFVGRTDQPLSEAGRTALTPLGAVDAVFVSPLARCRQTAEQCYPGYPATIVAGLQEVDFGCFEAKTHAELTGDPLYEQWLAAQGETTCHGGEVVSAFQKRVQAAMETVLLLSEQETYRSVAVVTHGGCIMAIMAAWTEGDFYHWQSPNGGGYRLCYDTTTRQVSNIRAFGGL